MYTMPENSVRIPEVYIRYRTLISALPCWMIFLNVMLAIYSYIAIVKSGLLPGYREIEASLATWGIHPIFIVWVVLGALEVLIYFLLLRKLFAQKKAVALRDFEQSADDLAQASGDPELLAQLSRLKRSSKEYLELIIEAYQDFTVGIGYTALFLILPEILIGTILMLPVSIPVSILALASGANEEVAIGASFILGQLLAAPLWYKLGYCRIFRRGRIKEFLRSQPMGIKAPRPGKYK